MGTTVFTSSQLGTAAGSRAQQQAARSAVELSSSTLTPGQHIIRNIALAHIASLQFQWDINLAGLKNYAGPDSHNPMEQLLDEMPKYAIDRISAAKFGQMMGLEPPMIAVWCRKVQPLALWEDNPGFNTLLGTHDGHRQLIKQADIYRASHAFWPSLPKLVELVLGPPTAAARALRHQPPVPITAALASTCQSRQSASASKPADPELADWWEAEPLPAKAELARCSKRASTNASNT